MVINRLYLSDKPSRMKYLIDTGADVLTYGQQLVTLDLGLCRVFRWPFIIAAVSQPIIGANFLRHYGLLVDIRHGHLVDSLTRFQTQGTVQQGNNSGIMVVNGNTKFHRLLAEFPSLVEATSAPRKLKHTIITREPPVFSKSRRLHPDKLKTTKQEFQYLVDTRICRPSSSCLASPLHLVPKKGISPLPEKVVAITNFPKPETVNELHRFLAIYKFYRRFVRHAARTQAVLNNYLKGAKRNDWTPILWSEESAAAFEKCKKDLSDATVLHHPSADESFAIVVDASDTAVGAALHQQTSKGWQPLAFFSNTLCPAQWRYSAYDRELLAAYMAIKYFRHMVEGRSFPLFTDHKPLVYAFKQKEDKCTPRPL
ncbi:retrovirus-related Pol polyprotein from transposon 17.6 [Trichonephila clavipes]|nr:retrovirus-related Pol polyprotein from transposon 17.6 [Trichonephila clavipes]